MIFTLFAFIISTLGTMGLLIHSGVLRKKTYKGMFVYYTNISNLVITVYETVIIIGYFCSKKLFSFLTTADMAFVMTLSIWVTHLIYHFILLPDIRKNRKKTLYSKGKIDNIIIHYIVPLMTVLQWIICADKNVSFASTGIWLLIPLTYFIMVMLRAKMIGKIGHHSYRYPYPFLNPDIIGIKKTLINFCYTTFSFAFLGLVLYGSSLFMRIF